jgi:sulfhydrogenase subunit gamma (sulfur reductase)
MKSKRNDTYLPLHAKIVHIEDMAPDIKLFKIKPAKPFRYNPGEFLMLSLWGKGEIPISISSTYGFHKYIELCIRRVGYVTTALHKLKPGSVIGIRGPLGNSFPIEKAKGKDILFIGGGLGLAPLRPLIHKVMHEKKSFKRCTLLCGSRASQDILFKDEILSWQKKGLQLFLGVRKSLQLLLTVGKKDNNLQGKQSLVAENLKIPKISFKNTHAFVCGPPIMITPTLETLSAVGIDEDSIFTSIEAQMKCGVGKCGHCMVQGKYICTDGPVFSYADIKDRRLYKH